MSCSQFIREQDFEGKSVLARRKAQQGWPPCEHFQRSRRVFEPKDCRVMKCVQTLGFSSKPFERIAVAGQQGFVVRVGQKSGQGGLKAGQFGGVGWPGQKFGGVIMGDQIGLLFHIQIGQAADAA